MALTARKLKEKLREADAAFPKHFAKVTRRAFRSAVKAGIPVTVAKNGAVWRVERLDGEQLWIRIKDLPAPFIVGPDTRLVLKQP